MNSNKSFKHQLATIVTPARGVHSALTLEQVNRELEKKNRELEQTRSALQEKTIRLEQVSARKSNFMAHMSHEFRSTINSILLPAKLLLENKEPSLIPEQLRLVEIILAAGNDLERIISRVLDFARIEAGGIKVKIGEVEFKELETFIERNFSDLAKSRGLEFKVELDSNLPSVIQTDGDKLIRHILKNLLANAFKFTSKGRVGLRIFNAVSGWNFAKTSLNQADNVIAFEVKDTGIGIPLDKQKFIFEPYWQAEEGVHNKYGGTGLGLNICRELAELLRGDIQLQSVEGQGCIFTLYLPDRYLGSQSTENPPPVKIVLRNKSDDRARGMTRNRSFSPHD